MRLFLFLFLSFSNLGEEGNVKGERESSERGREIWAKEMVMERRSGGAVVGCREGNVGGSEEGRGGATDEGAWGGRHLKGSLLLHTASLLLLWKYSS